MRRIVEIQNIYKAILNHVDQAVFVFDLELNIIYMNPAAEKLTGWTSDELFGKKGTKLFGKTNPLLNKLHHRQSPVFKSGPTYQKEGIVKTRSGKSKEIRFSVSPLHVGKDMIGSVVVMENETHIKKRIQFYEKVCFKGSLLETLVGNWYWDIIKDEFYFSDTICHILGWEPERTRITFEKFIKTVHPEDKSTVMEAINLALSAKKPYIMEHRILLRDGLYRAVHSQAQVIFDEMDRPIYMIGTIHDITEKKQFEEELEYRRAFEKILTTLSTNFIKLSIDETDKAIYEALRIIGEFADFDRSYIFLFSEDLKMMDNTHEWCAKGIESQIQRLQGIPTNQFPWWMEKIKRFETIYIPSVEDLPPEASAEKEEFQIEKIQSIIGVPMVYQNSLLGFVGFDAVRSEKECSEEFINLLKIVGEIFINALERRRAQKAVMESESKLNAMLSSIGDYICMVDKDLKIIWANEITKKTFGKDIIGKKCYQAYHHRNEPCIAFPCSAVQSFQDGKVHEQEIEIKTKSGQTKYCHWITNVALRDENGNPTAIIQIARDITEKKRAEEELLKARNDLEKRVKERTAELISANQKLKQEVFVRKQVEKSLRESEERFRSQYKGMPIPTYTWQKAEDSFDFMFIDYNDAAFKETEGRVIHYLGIRASEFYKNMPWILEDMKKCFTEKTSFQKEMLYRLRYKNSPGYFLASYAFVPPDIVLVHAEDITDRKKAEEELKLKDKAISSSINAFAIVDLSGIHTYVNQAFLKLWGYDDYNEVIGKPALSFLHDQERGLETAQKLREAGSWTGELVAKRKDGSLFDVYVSTSIVTDESGKPICQMASFADITERKRAEEKLAQMFKELEKSRDDMLSILNKLRMGTAITDKDGRIKFLSESAQHIIGISQKKALGRHWESLFPVTDEEKAQLSAKAVQHPELREKLPVHIETPSGEQYWIDIEALDEPGNPERKILFFYDMSEIYDLRRMLDEKAQYHDLTGKTPQMRLIYQQIQEVSSVDWTVLIEGETGTGKELVARAIHYSSPRKDKPFVPINCAGLTDSLLTSQLFGHKRGAFTGAIQNHVGLFEAANGGTIFLDEIGDISLNVQTNLLRVLEEKEITRVGESKSKKIDVRIIVATNRNLTKEVESGHFRPDLFYRIRVARIKVPPLRQRKEDIPLLVATFLGQCRAATGKPVQDISNEVMGVFMEYDWPGNVRELKSAIEFAVTHCKKSIIQLEDIPPEIREASYPKPFFKEIQEDEKRQILTALRNSRGNRTKAARLLGMSRATLYRHMATLDIQLKILE